MPILRRFLLSLATVPFLGLGSWLLLRVAPMPPGSDIDGPGPWLVSLATGNLVSLRDPSLNLGQVVAAGLPVSLTLGVLALLLAFPAGILVGRLGARAPSGTRGSAVAGRVVSGVPVSVLAPLLILVLALGLGWLPAALWGGPSHLVLPILALSLAPTFRFAWTSTLGTSGRQSLSESARRALPYLPAAIIEIALAGIVVESIFHLPGLGGCLIRAAEQGDTLLVLGLATVLGALVVLGRFLARTAADVWQGEGS